MTDLHKQSGNTTFTSTMKALLSTDIFLNNVRQIQGVDYTQDKANGIITFTNCSQFTEEIEIHVLSIVVEMHMITHNPYC